MEADGGQLIEHDVRIETELVERLPGEHARAVHGDANGGVLFEQRDVAAGARELTAGVEPGGPATDHDHIACWHFRQLRAALAHAPCRGRRAL